MVLTRMPSRWPMSASALEPCSGAGLADAASRFGDMLERRVDRSADGEVGGRRVGADAADVDDRAAALLEVRPGGARQPHRAVELEREPVAEVIVGELEEIAALGGAGGIHQNVDAAERLHRRLHARRGGAVL